MFMAQALMAAAPFCGLLHTLRDAAPWLELQPDKELRTLRAFAALANEFQPVAADAVIAPVTNSRPGFQVWFVPWFILVPVQHRAYASLSHRQR
jgi:hypothetical protein